MRAFGFEMKSFKMIGRVLGIGGLAAATLAMTPSPAQAGLPSPIDIHKRVHKRVVKDVRRVLEVPRKIHHSHVNAFKSFYHGRSYYGPHKHHHAVYRYPVYYGGHVSYRPYHYCNDSLFITHHAPLPRIYVTVRPGGYYYAPYPVPVYYGGRTTYRYDARYHDRCGDRCDHHRYNDHARYDEDRWDDHDRYDDDRYDRDRYDRDRYDDDRYDDRSDRDRYDDRYDHDGYDD